MHPKNDHNIVKISRKDYSFEEILSMDVYKREYSDEEILNKNLELTKLLGLNLNVETMELY